LKYKVENEAKNGNVGEGEVDKRNDRQVQSVAEVECGNQARVGRLKLTMIMRVRRLRLNVIISLSRLRLRLEVVMWLIMSLTL